MARGTPGSPRSGSGDVHNLTKGSVRELRNPATRTVGFLPTGRSSSLWSRVPDSVRGGLVNAGWAVPTMGGPLRPYLPGVSELDWSPDGRRIVYHPPTAGRSPVRHRARRESPGVRSMSRGKASTTTFPSGRLTARSSTSSRAWRSRKRHLAGSSDRRRARTADVPRLTRHLSDGAGQPDAALPRNRRRWIRALDLRHGRRTPGSPPHQHGRRGVHVACGECRRPTPGRDRFALDGRTVASADWRPRDRRVRRDADLAPHRDAAYRRAGARVHRLSCPESRHGEPRETRGRHVDRTVERRRGRVLGGAGHFARRSTPRIPGAEAGTDAAAM